jgi:hypothetical protein
MTSGSMAILCIQLSSLRYPRSHPLALKAPQRPSSPTPLFRSETCSWAVKATPESEPEDPLHHLVSSEESRGCI